MDHEHHIEQTPHASNTEMVMLMAEAKGFSFHSADLDETWTAVEMHR